MKYWWQHKDGIRIHFAEERERIKADYDRRIAAANQQENEMIEALKKHPIS